MSELNTYLVRPIVSAGDSFLAETVEAESPEKAIKLIQIKHRKLFKYSTVSVYEAVLVQGGKHGL